jgi:hypothetical protein
MIFGELHLHPFALILAPYVFIGAEDAAVDHLEELSKELSSDYLEEISTNEQAHRWRRLDRERVQR